MSLHKLSAAGGVDYLLRHTCVGDIDRVAEMPLSSYYLEAGYPPGRWMGAGLNGLADGRGVTFPVNDEAMTRLFALGLDPVTGAALGANWRVARPVNQRVAERAAQLPTDLVDDQRATAVGRIEAEEAARAMPVAVSGFDLTFTLPKSASVVWALADPATQIRIARAHAGAVADAVALLEQHAVFTRVGKNGVVQVATRGAVAAAFDHWDTRTGDPNLHTHVVIANKVQGIDGVWRSIDAKGLYAAVVAVSETYDVLVADKIAAATGTTWSVRARPDRSALFEIEGVSPEVLAEFSHRSLQVDACVRGLLTDFHTRSNRAPSRAEMLRIRQHATRLSRPVKQLRPLPQLLRWWRDRAAALLPTSVEGFLPHIVGVRTAGLRVDAITGEQLQQLAQLSVDAVMARRSTWTRWNLLAEAARATKPIRMATTTDRVTLLDRVAQTAIDVFCLRLDPPEITATPGAFRRADGSSAFRRHRAEVFTSPIILAAEDRLVAATRDLTGPRLPADVIPPSVSSAHAIDGGAPVTLAADQLAAATAIASSGRHLDVLVGPAGSGKTTTMRALKHVWETEHGPGSVLGLAPSAAAARELAASLQISCETAAKWIHETTGPTAAHRRQTLEQLRAERARAVAARRVELVAGIEHRAAHLSAVARRFELRPAQLLIIDEASLAGTLVLDELTRQTTAAGAKLLLVGDHRQLSSVDAGGAFGLLADNATAELTSLWRFTHPWEATATHQLRVGNPTALESYQAHGRLREGPAEVMAGDAYRGWTAAIRDGKAALLIAADNVTVAALNAQARADRIAAGKVEAGGVTLHDGTTTGVGDIIVTRANNRAVRTSTGAWVRNGDLWTVTARRADGSLTVRRNRASADPNTRNSDVILAASYVARHVELGYATTAHRAQGMTVDAAFTVLRPGMAREVAYVAMTRGRDTNTAYIATDIPDPAFDGAPEPDQTGRQVLLAILANAGAQLSATQTLRQLHHDAESLASLGAIHETLAQAASKHRWTHLITSVLDTETATAVLASPAYGPLVAVLRRIDHDGHNVAAAFTQIAAAGPPITRDSEPAEGEGQVRDPAAILQWRATQWLHRERGYRPVPRPGGLLAGLFTPAYPDPGADPEMLQAIAGIESRIAARADAVTDQLIAQHPGWLRRLGPPPADQRAAATLRAAITAIAVYRDAYAVTDTAHPLGAETPTDHDQLKARRRAIAATAAVHRPPRRAAARLAADVARTSGRTPTP